MALGATAVVFMKLYRYIGPKSIAERVRSVPVGTTIASVQDVIAWMKATGQHAEKGGSLIVTYIVDEFGVLRIADRGCRRCAPQPPAMFCHPFTMKKRNMLTALWSGGWVACQ
jgi:hypothetical protein